MIQEYFGIELSNSVHLGLSLNDLEIVTRFTRQDICAIPGVAYFWLGVVNYKGSLLWILDTDRLLGLEDNRDNRLDSKLTVVVISYRSETSKKRVGLTLKQLEGILTVDSQHLQPISSVVLKNLCAAVVEQDNKDIYILDTPAFMEQIYLRSEPTNIT